jgi:hypothetical protein
MNLPPVKTPGQIEGRVVEYRDRIANLDHSMSRELRALLAGDGGSRRSGFVAIGS